MHSLTSLRPPRCCQMIHGARKTRLRNVAMKMLRGITHLLVWYLFLRLAREGLCIRPTIRQGHRSSHFMLPRHHCTALLHLGRTHSGQSVRASLTFSPIRPRTIKLSIPLLRLTSVFFRLTYRLIPSLLFHLRSARCHPLIRPLPWNTHDHHQPNRRLLVTV